MNSTKKPKLGPNVVGLPTRHFVGEDRFSVGPGRPSPVELDPQSSDEVTKREVQSELE
ncbi:hypothetical protein [Sulfodiicoccus acidiphilus]|uniref:hypothetical protein n=1 Tax=Sulfodiicoccus acidiphilus TaxID=1670455 RepID=UPI0013153EFD|nr:hypothetical protein [Sulfodiicoccus acidiphilus]